MPSDSSAQAARSRLDALHAAGALSDAEYRDELAKLVGGDADGSASSEARSRSNAAQRWLVGAAVAVGLAGAAVILGRHDGREDAVHKHVAAPPARPNSDAATPTEVHKAQTDYPPAPEWAFRSATDPLTDLTTTAAYSRFTTPLGYVNVTIACKGGKALAYQLAAFGADGEAAPLRTDLLGDMNSGMHETARYTLRLDREAAVTIRDQELRFNNAISFSSKQERHPLDSVAAQTARAHQFVVQLQLENGDATVVVDQQAPQLRTFLDRCLSDLTADSHAQARAAVARCERANAAIRASALAARAAYKARGEPIPGYIGDEGTPLRADAYGNGVQDCGNSR